MNALNPFNRNLITLTALLLGITLPLYAVKVYFNFNMDFDVYYRAAQRIALNRFHEIYTLSDGACPFRYNPLWLPFFYPLSFFSQNLAKILWFFFQYFCFLIGFLFIYRSLCLMEKSKTSSPSSVTCLSILFIFRFFLDCLNIGQISGLMFLGFCLAFFGYLTQNSLFFSIGVFFPTALKIGPGILFGTLLSSRSKKRAKVFQECFFIFGAALIFFILWAVSRRVPNFIYSLFHDWITILQKDSVYYDSSHYGSQSLNSALLRFVKCNILSSTLAHQIHLLFSFFCIVSVALFWALRRPISGLGKGAFFSLGLFIYMWLMPETFKYSLTPLAIPIAILLSAKRSWFQTLSIGIGALTLSLAGLDLVGGVLFFKIQEYSLPFFSTLLLGAATLQVAFQHSKYLFLKPGPWPTLPPIKTKKASLIFLLRSTDHSIDSLLKIFSQYDSDFSKEREVEIICLKERECSFQLRSAFLKATGKKIGIFIQSSSKAGILSENLAKHAFALQNLPDPFFFEEVKHITRELGDAADFKNIKELKHKILELPVHWMASWILLYRSLRGYYGQLPIKTNGITADDWGLSPGVNQGILELAQRGVIQRVSLLANGAYLKDGLSQLLSIKKIQLGIHFNLTYGKSLHGSQGLFLPPAIFLMKWMLRKINKKWIIDEFLAQMNHLKTLHVPIQYLDGHHHIHLAPGMITTLSGVLQKERISHTRLPLDYSLWKTKKFPLIFLSLLARREMKKAKLSFSPCSYPSLHSFNDHGHWRSKLRSKSAKNNNLEIITHPAFQNDLKTIQYTDSYAESRVLEFRSLKMLSYIMD